ncbi:MAG TPA: SDR family oxidoreductase [Candidatus Deferrimicrobiaceae bacterium]|nr:SDR family oxidoreductase [Candidatus Deferrimicrobiaceae bacterium]
MTSATYPSPNPVREATSLGSKVAIVTGASSGIGLELTKKLIANGYRVVANSRRLTSAKTLSETSDLKLVDGDISLQETAQRVADTAVQHFGRIDLLVNNAGIFIPKSFTEYTAEDFRRATATNLAGFFYVSQLAVSQMRLQRSGHVVNVTTSFASQPVASLPASLANLTKGGLESVTRSLAIEFAEEGIRFNTIAPGVVNTPMHRVEAHEFLKQLSPMKRLAEVGEVADLLLYMESASFLNGEVVHLDGGAHAGKW